MSLGAKRKFWLVHQSAFDSELLSVPLALGYMKALALTNDAIRAEADLRIFNYAGGATPSSMVPELLLEEMPDVMAFSVYGWNYLNFGPISANFKQLNPNGWCIFGGTHVANQAEHVFRRFPTVDVVVNGEGESSFPQLVTAYLEGKTHDLGHIPGISYRDADGRIITTPPALRIRDLDTIPSPYLSGAIDLFDKDGHFLYDVAMIETNRGCPYACSFCYWGGAVGQKIFAFSRERLREELELLGRNGVINVALCDANFGMLPADMEFLEDLIRVRQTYGFPRDLITSWAKNKGKLFFEIVTKMKRAGFRADFTLALQSLSEKVIETMNRKNMKLNDFTDLCEWLLKEGFDCYAELIWGLPGETYESFLVGYDHIAQYIPRVATYSHIIMPNTEYADHREKYGILAVRNNKNDFENVLVHSTMNVEDNRRAHAFMFWSRAMAEYAIVRHVWAPLRRLIGLSQSLVIRDLDGWVDGQTDAVAAGLRRCRQEVVDGLDTYWVLSGVEYFYTEPGMHDLMRRWWNESIMPRVPEPLQAFFRDLFAYDWATRAVHDVEAKREGLPVVEKHGEEFYVRENLRFDYDIPALCARIAKGETSEIAPAPRTYTFYYRKGFSQVLDSHELNASFVARTAQELDRELELREDQAAFRRSELERVGAGVNMKPPKPERLLVV